MDAAGGENFINQLTMQARWAQLEPYRSDKTEERLSKILKLVNKKLDGALIVNKTVPQGMPIPGHALMARVHRDIVYALSTNKDLNDDYAELLLRVISGVPYKSSEDQKHAAFLDICLLSEIMVSNNIVQAQGRDPVDNMEGLKYFWNIFADPDDHGWVDSSAFCSFMGQVAHASKNGNGSDRGFIETFNILALRHKRGEEAFVDLDVNKMLSAVEW